MSAALIQLVLTGVGLWALFVGDYTTSSPALVGALVIHALREDQ